MHLVVSEFKDGCRVETNVLLNLVGTELSSWPGLAPRAVLHAFDQICLLVKDDGKTLVVCE